MKQINLTVDPIVDVTTQKGVIPSDTANEHFCNSQGMFSRDKKNCKIS